MILLIDRTFDIAAPLMHEYSYIGLVDDLLGGNAMSTLDLAPEQREIVFNRHDEYWQQYKCANIAEASDDLETQIKDYEEESLDFKRMMQKNRD